MLPAPTPVQERPAPYILPAPGWPEIDLSGPDPLLDRPYSAQPGWFANVETTILWPHLRNQLGDRLPNPFTGQADAIAFAGNRLDPTASPRFEVGYRLPDNWGSLSFGYRFLATQGHDQLVTGPEDAVQGATDQVGRFDYNMVDFVYGSREYSLDPNWNMRWGIGARMLFLYFDSRIQFVSPATDEGAVQGQSESNHLRCYGPWGYLDIERKIGHTGLSVFGRLEGMDSYARINQIYRETVAGAPGEAAQTLQDRLTGAVSVSMLREVVGLSYTVPRWNYSRFMLGYEYETYFQIGRLSTAGPVDTRGQLDVHGLFLRAELNF
jgi:hypothetical protein